MPAIASTPNHSLLGELAERYSCPKIVSALLLPACEFQTVHSFSSCTPLTPETDHVAPPLLLEPPQQKSLDALV